MAFIESRINGTTLELTLHGEWRATSIAPIRDELAALELGGAKEAKISAADVPRLDMAGAWALDELTRVLTSKGIAVQFAEAEPPVLLLVRSALDADSGEK